jgi:hypothetical protein
LWRGHDTGGRTNRAADERTSQRASSAADGRADRGAPPGANQRATRSTLAGIVRIGAGGYRQYQTERRGALDTSA